MKQTSRNRIYSVIKLVLIITALTLFIARSIDLCKIPEPVRYERYVVESGDTLWRIASQSDGYNTVDTRHIIHAIQQESNITASIYSGQIIYVPMYND